MLWHEQPSAAGRLSAFRKLGLKLPGDAFCPIASPCGFASPSTYMFCTRDPGHKCGVHASVISFTLMGLMRFENVKDIWVSDYYNPIPQKADIQQALLMVNFWRSACSAGAVEQEVAAAEIRSINIINGTSFTL